MKSEAQMSKDAQGCERQFVIRISAFLRISSLVIRVDGAASKVLPTSRRQSFPPIPLPARCRQHSSVHGKRDCLVSKPREDLHANRMASAGCQGKPECDADVMDWADSRIDRQERGCPRSRVYKNS